MFTRVLCFKNRPHGGLWGFGDVCHNAPMTTLCRANRELGKTRFTTQGGKFAKKGKKFFFVTFFVVKYAVFSGPKIQVNPGCSKLIQVNQGVLKHFFMHKSQPFFEKTSSFILMNGAGRVRIHVRIPIDFVSYGSYGIRVASFWQND